MKSFLGATTVAYNSRMTTHKDKIVSIRVARIHFLKLVAASAVRGETVSELMRRAMEREVKRARREEQRTNNFDAST
jgi:hypothetical protein